MERQQSNLDHYHDRKLLLLNIDVGGVRSRMMIDRAIAEEVAGNVGASDLKEPVVAG